jgi:hypothetical protein
MYLLSMHRIEIFRSIFNKEIILNCDCFATFLFLAQNIPLPPLNIIDWFVSSISPNSFVTFLNNGVQNDIGWGKSI